MFIFSVAVYTLKKAYRRQIPILQHDVENGFDSSKMESSDDDNDSGYSNSSSNLVSGSIPPSTDLGKTELAMSLINSSERNPALLKARVLWDYQDKFGTLFNVDKNEIVNILYRENDQVCVMNKKGQKGFLPFSYCTLFRKSKVVRSTSCGDYGIYGNQTAKVIYKGSVGKLQKSASEPNVNTTKLTSLPGNKLDGKVTYQEIPYVRPGGLLARSNDISNSLDECFIPGIYGPGKPLQDGADQGGKKAPETYYRRLKVSVMHFRRDSEEPVTVLFDFNAIDENDVSVERGETVYVLNKDDADWWWIEKENGDEGFVPRSYVSAELTKRLQGIFFYH